MIFCDWFAASQVYPSGGLPVVSGGRVIACDTAMSKIDWDLQKPFRHEGSHDTRLQVKCDGYRVSFSGNVSRFNRPDNLFGYSLDETKQIVNGILESLGLPPFTAGTWEAYEGKKRDGSPKLSLEYTGANISQIHMTENFSSGNGDDMTKFLWWLESQKFARANSSSYSGETYYIGETSKYARRKIYAKSLEIDKRLKKLIRKKGRPETNTILYLQRLAAWCSRVGILRHEVEFKTRYLTQNNLRGYHECTQAGVLPHYEKYRSQITMRCDHYTEISTLSARLQGAYYAYMAGQDLRSMYSTSAFYRIRSDLLPTGIDIKVPRNEQALSVKPRFIDLKPADMPDFYRLPAVADLLKAA
jgi:hypothetical protein